MGILTREEEYDKEKGKFVTKKKGLKDYLTREKTELDKKIADFEKKQKLQKKYDRLKQDSKKTETDKLKQQIKEIKRKKHKKTYTKIKNYSDKANDLMDMVFGPPPNRKKSSKKKKTRKPKTKYVIKGHMAYPIARPKINKPKKKKKNKKKNTDILNPSGIDWGF